MATVIRKTRVANPASRRSGKSRRKSLSPKQVKYFGTPQQKAALKRSRAAKRAATKRVNKASRPGARRTERKRNIGQIVTMGLGNPARKGHNMPKTRKSKARHQRSYTPKRRAKKNPFFGMGKKHRARSKATNPRRRRMNRPRRRQHNPSEKGVVDVFIKAAWVVGGLVGARGVTQALYAAANATATNTGWVGYISNIVMSFLLGGVVGKFVGKQQGSLVLIGGIAGVVARYVQENTSIGQAIGAQLSGLGDLGIYMPTTFFTPLVPSDSQTTAGGANMLLPSSVTAAIAAGQIPPPAPKRGMGALADVASGVGSRYATAGRYN